jgi:hypothetical protein
MSRTARAGLPARAALVAAGLGIGLTSCGVPVDRQPAALSRHGIPFNLLQPSAPSTTSTTAPSLIGVPVRIFLIGSDGHLAPVARDVPVSAPDLAAVLGALVLGPTDAEAASGLQTAIPVRTTILGATISGGIATVNLGGTFDQLVGPPQIQAVAQVVFTASSFPGVTGVTFELAGASVEVPVASGAQVPVANRSQFTDLAPTVPTTPANPA